MDTPNIRVDTRPLTINSRTHRPRRAQWRIAWTALLIVGVLPAFAQDTLNLPDCYALLSENYPLVRQKQLLTESATFNKEALQKNYLPQVNLGAQATYQSDVPHVPIADPGNAIPMPNKDQYRATVDVTQLLYDGGTVRNSLEVEDLNARVARQQVDVSLHQLKNQVNQAYFSVLLLQERANLLALSEANLTARLSEVRSAIHNGAALPASDDVIYAEILRIRQQIYEARADRATAMQSLADLIGISLNENIQLRQPEFQPDYDAPVSRPELNLYALQQQQIDATSQLMGKANAPKFSLFAQGGYGNPGLNVLDNTFQPFFMGGVRLTWKILDWDLVANQQRGLLVRKEIVDTQRQAFDLNTRIELNKYKTEIEKLDNLLRTDEEIIAVRRHVLQTARAQLQNGTMTASEYIVEANALNQSLITRKTHEITLLQAQANYLVAQGTITEPKNQE